MWPCSCVNKASNVKAKAKAKDLTLKAKAKISGLKAKGLNSNFFNPFTVIIDVIAVLF
jgi:hypothetical protein